MPERIIDSSSLLNLYTGWKGLAELAEFGGSWYISQSVIKECEYVREFGSKEDKVTVPMDLDSAIEAGLLSDLAVETEQERQDYVDFAAELDDGEAMSMALARNRDLVLVTDDKKALNIAQRADVAVETATTPSILKEWNQLNPDSSRRLGQITRRIRYLARFHPPLDSPDRIWWDSWFDN